MIDDIEPEAARAMRHRLADPAHADNAQLLAADAVAEHARRTPALPLARPHQLLALGEAARHREDERHGHVGGIVGEHAGRVGDDDAARARGFQVDMIHARAEIGEQFQFFACARNQLRIERIGDRRHQHVAGCHGSGQLVAGKGVIVGIERDIEQFGHALFDGGGELSRDDHARAAARFVRRLRRPGCGAGWHICAMPQPPQRSSCGTCLAQVFWLKRFGVKDRRVRCYSLADGGIFDACTMVFRTDTGRSGSRVAVGWS